MSSFTENILSKAKNVAEDAISKANAKATIISSESMQKANLKRKELQASCLKEVEQIILSIKNKAAQSGELQASELKNEVISQVVDKVVECVYKAADGEKVQFYESLIKGIKDNTAIIASSGEKEIIEKAAERLKKKLSVTTSVDIKEGVSFEENGKKVESSIRTLANQVLDTEKENIERILFPVK